MSLFKTYTDGSFSDPAVWGGTEEIPDFSLGDEAVVRHTITVDEPFEYIGGTGAIAWTLSSVTAQRLHDGNIPPGEETWYSTRIALDGAIEYYIVTEEAEKSFDFLWQGRWLSHSHSGGIVHRIEYGYGKKCTGSRLRIITDETNAFTGTLILKMGDTDEITHSMEGNLAIAGGTLTNEVPTSSQKMTITCPTKLNIENAGHIVLQGRASYHMASSDCQTTLLKTATTTNVDAVLEFEDDVDYEVGDTIWLGWGGDRTADVYNDAGDGAGHLQTPSATTITAGSGVAFTTTYRMSSWSAGNIIAVVDSDPAKNESIVLLTKTDNQHFTADFAYNHASGTTVAFRKYECEQVVIKSKINASTYTADTMVAHDIGDMVVHGTRNFVMQGTDGQGYQIKTVSETSTARRKWNTDNTFTDGLWVAECPGRVELDWGQFNKSGNTVAYQVWGFIVLSSGYPIIKNGHIKIKNSVFDKPYTDASGSVLASTVGVTISVTDEDIDNIHSWGMHSTINASGSGGHLQLGRVVAMGCERFPGGSSTVIYYTRGTLRLRDFWACHLADPSEANESGIRTASCHLVRANIVGFYIPLNMYISDAVNLANMFEFEDVTITHSDSSGFSFYSNSAAPAFRFKNCDFYHCRQHAFSGDGDHGDLEFVDCQFDFCGFSTLTGAIGLDYGASAGSIDALFRGCKFGLRTRNYANNILLGSGLMHNSIGRVMIDNCEFKKPIYATERDFGDWGRTLGYMACDSSGSVVTGRELAYTNSSFSLEFVNPKVYDSDDTELWAVDYPGVSRYGIASGGVRIRPSLAEEPQKNGLLALTMLPYACHAESAGTRAMPMRIPLREGQSITVSLYLQKNISMPSWYRPALHMRGLGIDATDAMSDAIDTWELVEVSGQALLEGVVDIWITPGINGRAKDISSDEWNSPQPVGYSKVYADGMTVYRSGEGTITPTIVYDAAYPFYVWPTEEGVFYDGAFPMGVGFLALSRLHGPAGHKFNVSFGIGSMESRRLYKRLGYIDKKKLRE